MLAIDPLPKLLSAATDMGLLSKIRGRAARFRASLYADDAAIFIRPDKDDFKNLTQLLYNFGEASGLNTNLAKMSVTPISCEGIDLQALLDGLPIKRSTFPIKFLGLPLSPTRLRRVDFQPLIDKAASKLSAWHGKNLTQAGRATLTKSVLSAQPIYLLTALKPHKEVLDEIDKIRKRFLWAGDQELTGGKCKVNWIRSCLPKKFGGLGVLNLDSFSRALRLRWLWHEWVSPEKAWVGSDPRALFRTGFFSQPAQLSHLEMAKRQNSGNRGGSKDVALKTLRQTYTNYPKTSNGRWRTPSIETIGFGSSETTM